MLRRVDCYLVPSKLESVRELLLKMGIEGMSFSNVTGFGTRSKVKAGVPQFEDRVKVEIVVDERAVDNLVRGIKSLAGDGEIGAGIVFVSPVEDAVRLGTREHGKSALF